MKTIEAVFQTIGKRRKLIGYRATVDNYELPGLYETWSAAEKAANDFIYDDLSRAGLFLIGTKVA